MRNRFAFAAATGAVLVGLASPALAAGSAAAAPAAPAPATSTASPAPTASTPNTPTPNTPTPSASTPARKSTTVTLNPPSVARGGSVMIGGGCWDSYGKPATAQSTAFGTLTLNPMDGGPGARITIGDNVAIGKHVVNVRCADGATGSATLTVVGPQTKKKPVGGVQAGGGGTATGASYLPWAGLASLAGLGAGLALLRRRSGRA